MLKKETTNLELQWLSKIAAMLRASTFLLGLTLVIPCAMAAEVIPEVYDNDPELRAAGVAAAENSSVIQDPFEHLNRGVFFVNDLLDGMILAPVATAYTDLVPKWGRARVSSVLDTLKQPVYFINYVLQGDRKQASRSLRRFGYNSTFGLLGLFDIASKREIYSMPTDAGLTLAHHCAKPGPYIVLPLLGPSNMRDAIGSAADVLFFDPSRFALHQKYYRYKMTANALDTRAKALEFTQDIDSITLDKYSSIRSMYTQHRAYALQNALQYQHTKCTLPKNMQEGSLQEEIVGEALEEDAISQMPPVEPIHVLHPTDHEAPALHEAPAVH